MTSFNMRREYERLHLIDLVEFKQSDWVIDTFLMVARFFLFKNSNEIKRCYWNSSWELNILTVRYYKKNMFP